MRRASPALRFLPLMVAAGLGLAGCTSDVPGLTTESTAALADTAGADATSSRRETLGANCQWLAAELEVRIRALAKAKSNPAAVSSEPPPTLEAIWEQVVLEKKANPASDYTGQRDEAEKYNTALKQAGCAPIDIDAEVEQVPRHPVVAAAK